MRVLDGEWQRRRRYAGRRKSGASVRLWPVFLSKAQVVVSVRARTPGDMTIVLRQQREQESEIEGESYGIPGPPEVDIGGRAGTAPSRGGRPSCTAEYSGFPPSWPEDMRLITEPDCG